METISISRIFRKNVTSVCYDAQKTGYRAWRIRSLIGGLDWGARISLISEMVATVSQL